MTRADRKQEQEVTSHTPDKTNTTTPPEAGGPNRNIAGLKLTEVPQ